jgi:photosystem II stability/assembly factor-like uncharacterized protein
MGRVLTYRRIISRISTIFLISIFLPLAPASADTFGAFTAINTTGAGTQNWIATASSYDGSIMYAAAQYGNLYKSVDSGTTWSRLANPGNKYWNAIATNDSGTVVYAAAGAGDSIYRSTDSGATWNPSPSTTGCNWVSISASATGSAAAAVCGSGSVYTTVNTGGSWPATTGVGTSAKSVSMSGDGLKLGVTTSDGVYLGTYAGSTWTFTPYKNVVVGQSTYNYAVSMSRDGQKIAAIGADAYVHITSNFGSTWETSTASPVGRSMSAIHLSGDKSRLMIFDVNGPGYYSTDNGVNWTVSNPNGSGQWSSVTSDYTGTRWIATISSLAGFYTHGIYVSSNSAASFSIKKIYDGFTRADKVEASDDGSVIAVLNAYGEVWVSRDAGVTWATASLPNSNQLANNCIAMSSDGTKILIGSSRYLYRSTDSGQTFAQITSGIFASNQAVYSLAMSGSGDKVALVISDSGIYLSSDGGQSFTQTETTVLGGTTYSWRNVTMTSDGTKMAIGTSGSNSVITSTDSGINWALTGSVAGTYPYMKSAGDGSVLIAFGSNASTQPIVSRNWGQNWSNLGTFTTKNFSDGISISYNGSLIVAANSLSGSTPYASTNYGSSFSIMSGVPTAPYNSIKVTGSKNYVIFAPYGYQISRMAVLPPVQSNFSALSLSASNIAFRSQVSLTATISTSGADGRVTFLANGKKIGGCIKVQTISLVATCTWKPSSRGAVTLSAISYPTDSGYLSASTSLPVVVANRTGNR